MRVNCRSDSFIILQRARGWWVVQRDPTGSGLVENDPSKQGWVPAGCLLETNVPVASAVAEATGGNTTTDGKPILPLSIISTSFPGIALMDYTKKGDEELDLKKDDALRVFKRYNHWSYVRFFRIAMYFSIVILSSRPLKKMAVHEVGFQ
jgi:bZIP factor